MTSLYTAETISKYIMTFNKVNKSNMSLFGHETLHQLLQTYFPPLTRPPPTIRKKYLIKRNTKSSEKVSEEETTTTGTID